jgi:hypothetical protein
MDYKYIEQLMERYWQCETSLEEEKILRTFFSQKDVPVALIPYKDLFTYEQQSAEEEVLGSDFDERMLSMIEEPAPAKARTVTLTRRLMPLFKAAAMVAIILTLGNAAQVAFNQEDEPASVAGYQHQTDGMSVAMTDSTVVDTLKQSNADIMMQPENTELKMQTMDATEVIIK